MQRPRGDGLPELAVCPGSIDDDGHGTLYVLWREADRLRIVRHRFFQGQRTKHCVLALFVGDRHGDLHRMDLS